MSTLHDIRPRTGVRVFSPDDYLVTPNGRVFTPERNNAAWEQLYADLATVFGAATPEAKFYLVMGVQGGGKSTWIRANYDALGPGSLYLDAAAPAARHRARALALAKRYGLRAVAVWIATPLDRALAQNARRPADEVVPEFAVRSVFALLEPPTTAEGFDEVLVVRA